jgi:hypothetical protein
MLFGFPCLAADTPALSFRGVVFFFAATRAALFSAVGGFVDGGPGALFGFGFGGTAFLVAFFDMLGLSFLFVSVTGFIAARHKQPLVGFVFVQGRLNVKQGGRDFSQKPASVIYGEK